MVVKAELFNLDQTAHREILTVGPRVEPRVELRVEQQRVRQLVPAQVRQLLIAAKQS